MEENNNFYSSKFFGDAIIIAFITALGYLATFIFEKSYTLYFGVNLSSNFISFPVQNIVLVTSGILLSVILCLQFSKLIYKFICPKTVSKQNASYHLLSVLLAYFIPFTLIKIFFCGFSLSIVVELIVIFFSILVYYLICKLIIKLFRIKNEEYKAEENIFDYLFLNSYLNFYFGRDIKRHGIFFILMFSFLLISIVASDLGTSTARRKEIYNIINTNPRLAVLDQFQNILVATPFNQENKQIIPQIHLIDINNMESRGLFLMPEKIGPLQPAAQDKDMWDKMADWLKYLLKK